MANKKKSKLLFFIIIWVVIFLWLVLFYDKKQFLYKTISITKSQTTSIPIVAMARKQIWIVKKYDTSYYSGGYPPDDSWACSDVLWRAIKLLGYDFKKMIDDDMKNNPSQYSNSYDKNINFRRVQNIKVFLEKYAISLPTDFASCDLDQREQWQPGDIVTFDQIPWGLWHIAILSDKKNSNDVPLLIHNHWKWVVENDLLLNWPSKINWHFRIDFESGSWQNYKTF